MTKSRKRILLSSIAMLLVALVALGSATFAWFSIDKTVTAENITVTAIAEAGLEISKTNATTGFSNSVDFTSDAFSIKPVSYDTQTGAGFIPNSNIAAGATPPAETGAGTWKATGDTIPTSTAKSTKGFFAAYQVWVRSAADSSNARIAHTDVKATVKIEDSNTTDDKSIVNAARVRFIDSTTSANTKNFWTAATGNGTGVKDTAGATNTVAFTTHQTATAATATDNTDNGKAYLLLVWFDGEDSACVDDNKDAGVKITLSFTADDM